MKEIKLTIPEGCKTVTVKVDGEQVITEFEPKEEMWEPKDGDIYSIGRSVAIYNGNYRTASPRLVPFYCGLRSDGYLCFYEPGKDYGFGYLDEIRPATDDEKQRLFDALAKEGKRWNAEKKQMEDLPRWRAKDGEKYFYVTFIGTAKEDTDNRFVCDNECYSIGNYFKTSEVAEKVAEQIREIFKNSKAE